MRRVAVTFALLGALFLLLPWQLCDCREDGAHLKLLWDATPCDHDGAPSDAEEDCDGLFYVAGSPAGPAAPLAAPPALAVAGPARLSAPSLPVLPTGEDVAADEGIPRPDRAVGIRLQV